METERKTGTDYPEEKWSHRERNLGRGWSGEGSSDETWAGLWLIAAQEASLGWKDSCSKKPKSCGDAGGGLKQGVGPVSSCWCDFV